MENYSILSSVYKNETPENLEQSIISMVTQSIPSNDYVVVKDGPLTPELDDVLKRYSEKYPYIHIIELEQNRGLGYALNVGLKCCKNELVARMDTDDISLSSRCELQLKEFRKRPELDIVGTSIYEFEDDPNVIKRVKKMPVTQEEIYRYGRRRNPFNHPTVMYRKSVILKNGGYEETRRGEDFSLFTKLIYNGAVAYNISEPLLKYRSSNGQFARKLSNTNRKAIIETMIRNYKKGYARLSDVLVILFIQVAVFLCPACLGRFFYKRYSRKKMK